jgi:hypothetical protein
MPDRSDERYTTLGGSLSWRAKGSTVMSLVHLIIGPESAQSS